MRTLSKIGLAVVIAAFAAAPAMAQTVASTDGSTTIVRPVTISKTADLAFGRIVRPTSATSTVSLTDASDTVGVTGNGLAGGGTTSRAKYTISGEGGQIISLTVPASFTMTHTNETDELEVTLDPDLTATPTLSNSLGSAGSASLNVGGSFDIATTTVTGAYSGSFDVEVAYQ